MTDDRHEEYAEAAARSALRLVLERVGAVDAIYGLPDEHTPDAFCSFSRGTNAILRVTVPAEPTAALSLFALAARIEAICYVPPPPRRSCSSLPLSRPQ